MTEATHEFTPMDVNSQICKICGGTPGGKLHRRATVLGGVKPQVPTQAPVVPPPPVPTTPTGEKKP
jgi:hypothetical protein